MSCEDLAAASAASVERRSVGDPKPPLNMNPEADKRWRGVCDDPGDSMEEEEAAAVSPVFPALLICCCFSCCI